MVGIIYKYESPTGKIYIGQTTREKERMCEHRYKSRLNVNEAFHNALRKYGWESFSYCVLERLETDDADYLFDWLNEREIYNIKKFHSDEREYGYNLTSGGNLNKGVSEETKEKLRQANLGKHHSSETRCKMSDSHKGISHSADWNKKVAMSHRKPISQYTLEMVYIRDWDSALTIQMTIGVNKANVASCCKGKLSSAGGYKWKYKNK